MKALRVLGPVWGLLALGCNGSSPAVDGGIDAQTDVVDAAVVPDIAVDTGPPAPINYPMPIAANAVPPTDARWNGQYQFLYDAWGTEVLGEWPPAAFMASLMTSEPAVFGNQFASFGFVTDPNDTWPYGFKPGLSDPTQVHETCAMCHVATLSDGRVWFGMPNTQLDIGRFQVAVNQRWVAAGHPPIMTDLEAQKAMTLGPGRESAESGDYPTSVPADFPVYFSLGQRTALNYMGTERNVRSEAYLAIYSFGAGSPNAMTARVPFPTDARLAPFLSFFGSMDPPAAPAGDAAMIAAGAQVFTQAHCDSCHHVGNLAMDGVTAVDSAPGGIERLPGADPAWPRGSIRTDPLQLVLQNGTQSSGDGGTNADSGSPIDQGLVDLVRFIIAHGLAVGMTDGYRVGDVRALSFSAPYLHNGSVPTLEDLFTPAAMRPTTFMRGPLLFDTTIIGNSNAGHEFGTTLSLSDRTALIAYLRSL